MGELIPFPTSYLPTFDEYQRLEAVQRQIKLWRAELSHEQMMRGMNYGERILSWEAFHNGWRNNLKVIKGYKGSLLFRKSDLKSISDK